MAKSEHPPPVEEAVDALVRM